MMKYRKVLRVAAIIVITLLLLVIGMSLVMGMLQGGHVRPPH